MTQSLFSYDYLEMTSEKIFSPDEKVYVTIGSYSTPKIGIRIYKLNSPKDYLSGLKNIHNPEADTKRRAANLFQLKRNLGKKMSSQWTKFVRGNFNSMMRYDVVNSLALKSSKHDKVENEDHDLFPLLKGYKLYKQFDYQLKDTKSYYDYNKIPLDIKEKGTYLIEGVYNNKAAYTVVIISDIAFVSKTFNEGRLIYVTDRKTGEPVENAEVEIFSNKKVVQNGTTNSEGIYQYQSNKKEANRTLIFVKKGNDFSLSDPYFYRSYASNLGACYIYTSRPVYRPGQKVSFKAIIREIKGNLYELPSSNKSIQITIKDNKKNELFNRYLKPNEFGSVNGEIDLPDEAALGNYQIIANYDNRKYYSYFKVDKYKKPEYEVKVKTDKKYYTKGDVIRAKVDAKYYFGSPVSKGKVEYHVYRTRYFVPWYDTSYSWYYSSYEGDEYSYSRTQEVASGYNIKLKPDGTAEIVIDTKKINARYKDRYNYRRYQEADYRYRITATVSDQSRRNISGSSSALVTRSDHHLTISTKKWCYEKGQNVDILVKAKYFEGGYVKNKEIEIELLQEKWEKDKKGKYRYKEYVVEKKIIQTDDRGQAELNYTPKDSMYLVVKAKSKDKLGNWTSKKRYIYIYSSGMGDSDGRISDAIKIITDKSDYKLGETAKVIFNTPVKKGYILVTGESKSIPFSKVLEINNKRAEIDLKIEDAHTPNIWIAASLIFNNKLYQDSKEIIVPPIHKFLNVQVLSNKKQYKPGESAEFNIVAKNAKGDPVKAEVSIGIVDASIYAIARDRTSDIRQFFYSKKYNGVSTSSSLHFRFWNSFKNKELMTRLQSKQNIGLASYKEDDNLKQAKIRKNFKDEILWLPAVQTDSDGKAVVNFKFPDNLTRWRTTARVITKDTYVGNVTHKVIVRKNLMVRMALPRFYREKDKAILSTIVHNYLKSPKKVHLSLEAKGLNVLDKGKKIVNVPSNGEVRVDWNVEADVPGKAVFLAKALTDEESDAVQKSIPVLPHGMKSLDSMVQELRKDNDELVQHVVLKDNYIKNFTELEINMAPSVVIAMNTAIPYLVKEPYGCVEQTMSKFLPLVLVDDIVKKVGYSDANLTNKINTYYKTGIERLYHLQHSDGGWGWWTNDETHPYMTAYALSGIIMAKELKRSVKQSVINRGVKSLQNQLKNNKLDLATRIYMLKALSLAGKGAKSEIEKVYKDKSKLNPHSKAILTQLLIKEKEMVKAQVLMKELVDEAKKGQRGSYWEGKGWKYNWRNDSEETTANVVRAIAMVDSEQTVISPAVQWIMSQRRDNRWRSTKSTAIMIHALYDIASRRKEFSANYTADVILNGNKYKTIQVGEDNKSLKAYNIVIPEKDLNSGINIVRIEKNGSGSLYYSSTLRYYEQKDWFEAKDNGLSVSRKYYRLVKEDDGGEIRYRKVEVRDRVVSGDVILVELHCNTKKKGREYVIIEDQLPSGCEVVRNDKGYTIEGSQRYKGYRSWRESYYASREVHDEKVGIAKTFIYKPNFKLEYLIRAEIPGEYKVMPANLSLMYFPEVNGRSDEFQLKILDKQ